MHLFITCPPNLEQLLTEELQELGMAARRWPRGVSAPLSIENVYIINYGKPFCHARSMAACAFRLPQPRSSLQRS